MEGGQCHSMSASVTPVLFYVPDREFLCDTMERK